MTSQEIIEQEKKYGANNYAPLPVVLSRGLGVHLWDPEEKRYFDFLSGIGAVSPGHSHPKIIAALVEQAQRLTLVSRAFYGDNFGAFAKLATRYFGFDKILVMNTGVEAVETAIKLCRKWGYTQKHIAPNQAKIVVCSGNFHGRTLGAVSASGTHLAPSDFGPLLPGFVLIPFNDLPALKAALMDSTVAGFLVEPIQGEGGVVVPSPGYLQSAHRLCKEANVLLIADEVQTGIARTGMRLACDHEDVHPDILVLGKALSGGVLPVSAVLADDAVMSSFVPGDHGSTFGGNPLACAVATAALGVIADENLAENAACMGEKFRQGVRAMSVPWIQEVRGKGLLNAVVIDSKSGVSAEAVCLKLKDNGLLAKNTRDTVIRFAPPLMITEAQMDEALEILRRTFQGFAISADKETST